MNKIIDWLLDGDISVMYQVHKYLLKSDFDQLTGLQNRIETEGFGAELLSKRTENGHWGLWFYQPKWTSSHYTLTDLKNLGMPTSCPPCREMVSRAFTECQLESGGVNFAKSMIQCDICVNGMILNYAAYFCPDDQRCEKLTDFLLGAQKDDGGFGWSMSDPKSDAHTTIAVLEGFLSYKLAGFTHLSDGIEAAGKRAVEYLFSNGLFIDTDIRYRKLSYPFRYRYDLLRVLEYFVNAEFPYDERMVPALDWLSEKRSKEGLWTLENRHQGNEHFIMEDLRKPSRFITLKALRALDSYA